MNNILKNYLSLSVALYSTYSLLFLEDLTYTYHIVSIYAFIDLFLKNKIDIIIHHLAVIQLYIAFQYFQISPVHYNLILPTLLLSEVSTIFLNISNIISNKIILDVNKILFVLAFVYFRIINFYKLIIDENMYILLMNYCENNFNYLLGFGGIYILYGLNIYWSLIIGKTLLKPFIQTDNSIVIFKDDIVKEILLKYTYSINIFVSCNIYKNIFLDIRKYWFYIFDILGITILSVHSFLFHKNCANNLYYFGNFNLISDKNLKFYLADITSIYVRIFGTVITNYFNSRINNRLLLIILIKEILLYYIGISNIIYYIIKNKKLLYYDDNNKLKFIIKRSIGYLILFNTYILLSNSVNFNLIINNCIVIYIIFIINIVKPFYHLNHLLFHLLLIFQTHFLAKNNTIW
jgi:hypothetical protein